MIMRLVLAILITGITTSMSKKEEPKKEPNNTVEPSKKEEVTITFDTDGGEKIESMKVEKDSEIELPGANKEGYTFLGWYDGDTKMDTKIKVSKDMTVKAKWEEIKKEAETMKVSFDSNGGSKVSTITLECGKSLSLPKAPTKDGYTFVNWTRNGKVISNGTKLECKDITLTANWKKNEEPKKEEPKKEEPKKEPEKVYKCQEGYTLNGTKCTKEENAKEKCDGERVYEYEGKCVTITYNARKDTQNTCGKTTVHTGGGHTEEVQGELFKMGTNFCFFKQVTDSYENNQSNCTSRGHKWNSSNGKCYYYRGDANQYVTSTCNHLNGYLYITNPNQFNGVNGLNGGCYPTVEKTKYCDKEGFTLTNGKCIKTVDATLE